MPLHCCERFRWHSHPKVKRTFKLWSLEIELKHTVCVNRDITGHDKMPKYHYFSQHCFFVVQWKKWRNGLTWSLDVKACLTKVKQTMTKILEAIAKQSGVIIEDVLSDSDLHEDSTACLDRKHFDSVFTLSISHTSIFMKLAIYTGCTKFHLCYMCITESV